MGGGKRGTTGEAAGAMAGRRRTGVAADELDRRKPAGRGNAARPGGMALVDPWGALLAGLLVAEEPAAEPTADDPGDGREPPDPIAAGRVRRPGGPGAARTRGRDKGTTAAGGGGGSGP